MSIKLRTRLLRSILYVLGIMALAAFCVTKSPRAMERMTSDSYRYGDLYHFAKIRRFKPPQPICSDEELLLPPVLDSAGSPSIDPNTFRTFLFGDSFASVRVEKLSFSDALGGQLGGPVYFVSKHQHEWYYRSPLLFFSEHSVDTNQERTVVLEIVERYVCKAFAWPPVKNPHSAPPAKQLSWIENLELMPVRFVSGSERNHEFLLKNSFITSPIVEAWNSFAFEVFRKTPSEVQVYSLTPSMLFFNEETDPSLPTSFYAKHDDELITRVSQNIAVLASELYRQYHVRLIFVPIPNKFTVYSRLVTHDPYDDLIPRLACALNRQGVTTVNLLPTFRAQTEMLYQPADTHWNATGIKLAVPLVARSCDGQSVGRESSSAISSGELITKSEE